MRNGETVGLDDLLIVENQIEIKGSGTPMGGSNPAELFFDLEKLIQQFFR